MNVSLHALVIVCDSVFCVRMSVSMFLCGCCV